MPIKKTKVSDAEVKKADKLKKDTKAPVEEEDGNFFVLSCSSENITTGTKLSVVKTTKTPKSAVDYIKKLTSSRPEYLCIVEKKGMYSRKPQIVVKEINN